MHVLYEHDFDSYSFATFIWGAMRRRWLHLGGGWVENIFIWEDDKEKPPLFEGSDERVPISRDWKGKRAEDEGFGVPGKFLLNNWLCTPGHEERQRNLAITGRLP